MVMVIIGVLAALVLPKVRVDNAQVDAAARSIGMTLMAAQRDASSRQHNVLVVFDTASHLIRTVWDANNNGRYDGTERTRLFLLPDRVEFGRPPSVPALAGATDPVSTMQRSSRGPFLVMQRNGAVDRAVTLYLSTIRSIRGGRDVEARAVMVARATGRPSWYAWTGTRWRRGL